VIQVVDNEDDLLPTAKAMAQAIAKRKSSDVVKLVKEMQQKGQAYDIRGALKYELDIAIKAYEKMGRSLTTKAILAGTFASRSKL
jgi:enoyl-CoA hydratase/carnithine racemase